MNSIERFAELFYDLYERGSNGAPGKQIFKINGLTTADAYRIQELVAARRMKNGEAVAGFKVGCTSKAIQTQFGITQPISARMFHPHIHEQSAGAGLKLDWQNYTNCAIEPEMVFKIGKTLGEVDHSDEELIDAIEYVSPGIELHHYRFVFEPPTLQELISTGGIHAGLVVGAKQVAASALQFHDEVFRVFIDDEPVTTGAAAEIMGGPLNSLRWLVNSLVSTDRVLKAGSLVIPGSPVELVTICTDCHLRIEIDGVGDVATTFEAGYLQQ